MTVLDFGPSAYARRSPYIFGDDLENSGKVIIPEGDLPLLRLKYEVLGLELKFRPDLELLNQGLEPNSIISMEISEREFSGFSPTIDKLLFVWIKEKDQWVGITHNSWWEDNYGTDESYGVPCSLDKGFGGYLHQVFKIPEGRLSFRGCLHTSPGVLERIALHPSLERLAELASFPFHELN